MQSQDLTQAEFDAHIAKRTLCLAFVGMSNVGKSYRSKVLRDESDFMWYDVDGEILKEFGFKTLDEISQWLGYPSSEGYVEREKQYLECENVHTKVDFLDAIGKNLVFDTTGSVIYLPASTHAWLRDNCLMVNLVADENSVGHMTEKFFEYPKPVAWAGLFVSKEGESDTETLKRCYPHLLSHRLKKYRELANIHIPAEAMRDKNGPETLNEIRNYLEQ